MFDRFVCGAEQLRFLHGVDCQLREGAAADALRQLAWIDQYRPVDVLGEGREAGGQDEHVGVDLELPVARVTDVELRGAIKAANSE